MVDYLWAWQVTVPEAVDAGKWQRMYDTYVADRRGLNVRERFKGGGNLRAYQAITDRMLSAIERGYWQPPDAVRQDWHRKNTQAINEAGVACGADACSRATLRQAPNLLAQTAPAVRATVAATPAEAPAMAPETPAGTQAEPPPQPNLQAAQPAAGKAKPPAPEASKDAPQAKISGFEMETLSKLTPAEKTIGTLALLALAAGLIGMGYGRRRFQK